MHNFCKKQNGATNLEVRLTDAPASFDAVNVDIQEVRVHSNDEMDTTGWITLGTKAGVYNLLALQNGIDTVLASGTLRGGIIKEIRFVLGSNNTIIDNGITYPLTIPSGSESGLKIKLNKNLEEGSQTIVVDFDAGMSVSVENSEYKLRPVIRVK